jgi:hypothetical protein
MNLQDTLLLSQTEDALNKVLAVVMASGHASPLSRDTHPAPAKFVSESSLKIKPPINFFNS